MVIAIPWWLVLLLVLAVIGIVFVVASASDERRAIRSELRAMREGRSTDPYEEWKRNGMQGPVPSRTDQRAHGTQFTGRAPETREPPADQ